MLLLTKIRNTLKYSIGLPVLIICTLAFIIYAAFTTSLETLDMLFTGQIDFNLTERAVSNILKLWAHIQDPYVPDPDDGKW